ncbi:MAG: hypothetical protein Q8Q85_06645, partial [Gemmatimonadales bacterium]|nr:hypothetical protein [Gemmatimonadales bacterium]
MSALLYRRKPLTFSVIRWDSDPATQKAVEAWLRESKQTGRVDGRTGTLDFILAERSAYCAPGDYLVRGIDDEVYPVLARRFAQLYEAAPAAPA